MDEERRKEFKDLLDGINWEQLFGKATSILDQVELTGGDSRLTDFEKSVLLTALAEQVRKMKEQDPSYKKASDLRKDRAFKKLQESTTLDQILDDADRMLSNPIYNFPEELKNKFLKEIEENWNNKTKKSDS